MPDTKISALPTGGNAQAGDEFVVARGGTNVKIAGSAVAAAVTTISADVTVNGVRVGRGAGAVSTNTAVGASALNANTTGARNTAVGNRALVANTTGNNNVAIGTNDIGDGTATLDSNTTGTYNVAVGSGALSATTTSSENCAIGSNALYAFNDTVNTSGRNTAVGTGAGISVTSGVQNTFVGALSGRFITTGSKHSILGFYDGNSDSLDIRTSNGYAVISDGDGNRLLSMYNGGTLALDGGAVPQSGTGITFPATQSASSDANTLDDYEEGTFTPTIGQGITGITYTTQTGRYTKIGRLVYFNVLIATSAGTRDGNQTEIHGLPFTPASTGFTSTFYGPSAITTGIGRVVTNARVALFQNASTIGTANINGNNFSSDAVNVFLTGCYEI